MSLFGSFFNNKKTNNNDTNEGEEYEYCPRCQANLTYQKGYKNSLSFWICKGCGEMLINPEIDSEDDVAWFCDGCESMLNTQEGFNNNCGKWNCTECGYTNSIDASEVYLSDDEYQQELLNPYRGLSDEDVLIILSYEEIKKIDDRENILLIRDIENNQLYVKKYLKNYDISVYKFLQEHPVEYMPRLIHLFEGVNNLIIIEEYIEGRTLSDLLTDGCINQNKAVKIAISLCKILKTLHNQNTAIIHRDIKPSNIIVDNEGIVFLLDINVAKWYKEDEIEDTKLYGTLYYAAPEQFGYGFSASSEKTDIYAVGILLNVMLTGKMPKEEKAPGSIWAIIEKCIDMEPKLRYSAEELIDALERI